MFEQLFAASISWLQFYIQVPVLVSINVDRNVGKPVCMCCGTLLTLHAIIYFYTQFKMQNVSCV